MAQAIAAQAGSVMTHARTMFPPTPHRTAENLLDAPTPMIVDEMIWVVERGSPILEATSITVAAEASAANPFIGLRLTRRTPRVFMILHPPIAVPSAMAVAHRTITQRGI